jgi:hypothetical protein
MARRKTLQTFIPITVRSRIRPPVHALYLNMPPSPPPPHEISLHTYNVHCTSVLRITATVVCACIGPLDKVLVNLSEGERRGELD